VRMPEHGTKFAIYRQVSRAVSFDEYLSDREISDRVGCGYHLVHVHLNRMRKTFPVLMIEFDAIRHNAGAQKQKFSDDAIHALDEILA